MTNSTTTKDERARHVKQMETNFGLEDMRPDAADLELQRGYVNGTVQIEDMLKHAADFAAEAQRKVRP